MEPLPRFFPLDRLVAFSDGVFAVVITILVLGIEVPVDVASDAAGLAVARDKLVHQLLAYLVAFALVAMYWTQHGILYAGLRSADRRLVVLNLLFLIPVTLLPFVTQVMGARRDDWRVILIFAGTNLVIGSILGRQWKHVLALPEMHKGPRTKRLAQRLVRSSRFFGVVLVLGVLMSLLDVKAGMLVILFMPVLFFGNYVRMGNQLASEDASVDSADAGAP